MWWLLGKWGCVNAWMCGCVDGGVSGVILGEVEKRQKGYKGIKERGIGGDG